MMFADMWRELDREGYKIFSGGQIANIMLSNRLVRSATWDPSILKNRRMTNEVITLYKKVAKGGVGLIITGGLPVIEKEMLGEKGSGAYTYGDIHVEGLERLVEVIHSSENACSTWQSIESFSFAIYKPSG